MVLIDAGGDFLEPEAGRLRHAPALRRDRQRAHRRRDRGDTERALEQVAPVIARGDHIADGGIVAGIASDVFGGFERLRARAGKRSQWHTEFW